MRVRRTADRLLGRSERVLRGRAERWRGGADLAVVRDEIRGSWRRSAEAGVEPNRFSAPFEAAIDTDGLLSWAAAPILDRVGRDLMGARTALLLADQRAQIVARRAVEPEVGRLLDRIDLAPGFLYAEDLIGTNAIGTALAIGGLSNVAGAEHFADALTGMACVAVPVHDPASGRVIGILDVTSAARDASPLMTPLVKEAAWEIEQRLLDQLSDDDRMLHEAFLRARRSARGPIAAVSERRLLVNTPAAGLVLLPDRERLMDIASTGDGNPMSVALASGRVVEIRFEPVLDAGRRVGSLIRFDAAAVDPDHSEPIRPRALEGWPSLSDAEHAVAALVAEGRTNAETAARLFISPHTVDFHLRHIFAKLGVASRVEMTRVVLREQGLPNASGLQELGAKGGSRSEAGRFTASPATIHKPIRMAASESASSTR